MTQDICQGPAVLIGYEYSLRIEADAGLFPEGAQFAAHVRQKRSAAEPQATLTSDNGGLIRVDDTTLEIRIPAAETSGMSAGTVLVDVVRTDTTPPHHLRFSLEIPVTMPVTRGL